MDTKANILIVDDEESIRFSLQAILNNSGYACQTAGNADEAIAYLKEHDVDVVLSDIVMPRMTGVELLRKIKIAAPDVQVIMMTGEPTVDTATDAVRAGACDYLSKPIHKQELLRAVSTAALVKELEDETRRLTNENRRHQQNLERTVQERTAELESALQDWRTVLQDTIMAMGKVVETRDPYTAGHQERVAELSRAIGKAMGLPNEDVEALWYAGLVHDLGKIGVPAEILSQPGRLSREAFEVVKLHVPMGVDILQGIKFPWPLPRIVVEHHERLDGSGYPHGLVGDAISMPGRIIGIADTVESMASHRPYRPSLGIEPALAEIERSAGTQYDADAVACCVDLFRSGKFDFSAPKWQQ